MHLCFTNDSPSLETLSHLPPLPLLIDYSDGIRTMARKYEDNIQLRLRQHGQCVRRVALRAPSSSLYTLLEPMNKLFPRLEDLSLLCTTTDDSSLVLPDKLQAPGLRHLALHGIDLPKGFPLLSSTIALSTLSLTDIGASCYLPPGHLVTQIQGLPQLEELTFGFAAFVTPISSSEEEPLPALIPPVTLPTLRRLTFLGVGDYLDDLVAQINTPLLEQLSLTLFFELAVALAKLTKFIQRTEGLGCLVARVILTKDGASIYADHDEQQGIGKLSLHVNFEPLRWQISSVILVCHALGDFLPIIEKLTLDVDEDGMPSDWENTHNMSWYALLLPFVGVKRLHIGSPLALKLAQALGSEGKGLVLPALQELEVSLKIDLARKSFSSFMETRKSMGHPVHLSAPLHADEKVLVPPSVTSSGVHSVARSVSVPRGRSSPHAVGRAVGRSLRSLHEMVREVEQRLEEERLNQERLEEERVRRERVERSAAEQDRMMKAHVWWRELGYMRTNLERERLVLASLVREYLGWVEWERLMRKHLEQEQTEQEHLEWKRLERAYIEQERLEREHLERVRLVANRVHSQRVRSWLLDPFR